MRFVVQCGVLVDKFPVHAASVAENYKVDIDQFRDIYDSIFVPTHVIIVGYDPFPSQCIIMPGSGTGGAVQVMAEKKWCINVLSSCVKIQI